ncbi:hypothetical protein Taro_041702 [Colocasia esculenta]|uniref:TOD1/MUCI70 glycosyltransferase-like domain-containing protein n=1 Tax=Colocasia esculenta TaxID=4460 RepID=A0A843WM47_COLES|nr:hypothetical protein [Colocasia esculenta]
MHTTWRRNELATCQSVNCRRGREAQICVDFCSPALPPPHWSRRADPREDLPPHIGRNSAAEVSGKDQGDEWGTGHAGGTMTGGSLGLRSGSYGSLQQHLQSDVRAPIQTTPGSGGRKAPKMSLPGAKEKGGLPRIWRPCLAIRVGMFLVVMASFGVLVIVMTGFFFLRRGGDVSEIHGVGGSSPFLQGRRPFGALIPPDTVFTSRRDQRNMKELTPPRNHRHSAHNDTEFRLPVISKRSFSSKHPCEDFSIPPPPVDRKRTGPRPCPVCYIPVKHAIALMPPAPSVSPILQNLTYVSEEDSFINEANGGSSFGGHPSLEQRKESFNIKESMTVHCGFVRGRRPGNGTGFDIESDDLFEMEQCHGVVVASAIFGNYDVMQQPRDISEIAKRTVCFYMFVDEETEAFMKNSSTLDSTNRVGLWRVVVVRNLPYVDARRTGKVPKLLLHRLFPNARFSLWIDGKLKLIVDPYQILERFLWRKNATFAISRHYRRFDVFEEAEANKAAGKYDNASIDNQIEFYKNEGLTHYSSAKLPISSDVPEGCVIIREHSPITNLFTCLWFNEVDRFTSRDQLSFSTVRDKITSKVNWRIEMFLDCERRNFVVQSYHRDLLAHMMIPAPPSSHHLPPIHRRKDLPLPEIVPERAERIVAKKPPAKRGKDRRPNSRRRRPRVATNNRDNDH